MSCLAILLFKYRLESTNLTSNVKHIGGWGVGGRNWFQNIEVLHPSRLLAFSWPACTGDASHPVCLSHFPDVMSQGEKIHHHLFTFYLLVWLAFGWINLQQRGDWLERGGRGGVWVGSRVGKQSGVWPPTSSHLLSVVNPQGKGAVGGKHLRVNLPALQLQIHHQRSPDC